MGGDREGNMSENAFRAQLMEAGDSVISALDDMSWDEAIAQVSEIGEHIGMAKTNSLHQRRGADYAVSTLAENGLFTMLDCKYHDVPRTVEGHVREATLAGASLITVHASGGAEMLEAAVKGRDKGRELMRDVFKKAAIDRIGGVLGITVLTSLDSDDCESIFGILKEDEYGIKKRLLSLPIWPLMLGWMALFVHHLSLMRLEQTATSIVY